MSTRSLLILSLCSLVAGCNNNKCATKTCPTGLVCEASTGACIRGTGGGIGSGGGGVSTGGGSAGGGSAGGGSAGGGSTAGGMGGGSGGGMGGGGPITPAGEGCATAAVLPGVGSVDSTTTGLAPDFNFEQDGRCLGSDPGSAATADGVFRISVPSHMRLTVAAAASWDLVLDLITSPVSHCGSLGAGGITENIECVAGSDFGFEGEGERASWYNPTAAAVEVFILVKGYTDTDVGRFSLITELAAAPAGDVCDSAMAVTSSQTLNGVMLSMYGDDFFDAVEQCSFRGGPDRVYQVDVAAMSAMTVTALPQGQANPSLSLIEGSVATCIDPVACVGSVDSAAVAMAETLVVENRTAAMKQYYVVLDSAGAAGASASYSMNFSLAPLSAPPAGDVCSTATPITMSGTLPGQTTVGYFNDYQPDVSCTDFTEQGRDRVYSVTLNDGQTLQAIVSPSGPNAGDLDPAIYLLNGTAACTATPSCLVGNDTNGQGMQDSISYTNPNDGGVPQTLFIVIDTYFYNAPVTDYTLSVQITP